VHACQQHPQEESPMNIHLIALTCAIVACAENKPADTVASNYSAPASVSTSTVPEAPLTETSRTPIPDAQGTSKPKANAAAPGNATPKTQPASAVPQGTPQSTEVPPPDSATKADNTKNNQRDRYPGALTPMDQGTSWAETQITADVRKAVVGDKGLSFNAKNVKIVTVGSKVTLRGPVKTEQEKATIEALARQIASVTEVDNQLEVKK
jgi:hyperosmotically inducible periplasmic protein